MKTILTKAEKEAKAKKQVPYFIATFVMLAIAISYFVFKYGYVN